MGISDKYTGIGIYTYSEAAALLRLSPRVIKGLVHGYKYGARNGRRVLHSSKAITFDGREYLTFYDLMEVKFISYFLKVGIKRDKIAREYRKAAEEQNKPFPFATRFTTDGKCIFGDNKAILLDMEDEQYAMRGCFDQILYEGVDIGSDNRINSWRPFPNNTPEVILNPRIKFGRPILIEYGVPTRTLFDACNAEKGNIRKVSEWYGVPENLIGQAVEFESRIRV
ncbi:MAG: hypothetical protein LBO78_02760 [Rickettsiales bacterium]|jgi:uncharacterized protein (DUF433 family)|nr:hypothetical protein [Rickettsiales bacterium]